MAAAERAAAIREAAGRPDLFAELDARYPEGKGSDTAIRSYLLIQKFIPQAADAALRSYRETKALVEAEGGGYSGEPTPEVHHLEAQSISTAQPQLGTPALQSRPSGEFEWMRNQLGKNTAIRIVASGDMGPKEIGRLIKLLEAQKAVLDDEEDDPDNI